MSDTCTCPDEAGRPVCDLLPPEAHDSPPVDRPCPRCDQIGKAVQASTVKAALAVSLRQLGRESYLFCRTHDCPVVYFAADPPQMFVSDDLREPVYQKRPGDDTVHVCYCFRHTVGELRAATPAQRLRIIADITAGIQSEQCACDLRNPQGSCCLGNVRALIRQLEQAPGIAAT